MRRSFQFGKKNPRDRTHCHWLQYLPHTSAVVRCCGDSVQAPTLFLLRNNIQIPRINVVFIYLLDQIIHTDLNDLYWICSYVFYFISCTLPPTAFCRTTTAVPRTSSCDKHIWPDICGLSASEWNHLFDSLKSLCVQCFSNTSPLLHSTHKHTHTHPMKPTFSITKTVIVENVIQHPCKYRMSDTRKKRANNEQQTRAKKKTIVNKLKPFSNLIIFY